jgi:GT2 family glycosyltransferase
VAAAVLVHDAVDSLARVVDCLERQTVQVAHTIVFDNASRQDVKAALGERKRLTVLRSDDNIGVGAGHGRAWDAALADPTITHVWVLEHDTYTEPDCLEQLLRVASKTPAGAYVPRLERNREEALARELELQTAAPVVVPRLTFNGILLPRETIERVGKPVVEFFVGAEDWDYSRRLQKHGTAALKIFQALALHPTKGNKRFGVRPSVFRSYYSTRNWMYLNLEDGGALRQTRCWLWCAASLPKIIATEDKKVRRMASRIAATYDAVTGRLGRRGYWFLQD